MLRLALVALALNPLKLAHECKLNASARIWPLAGGLNSRLLTVGNEMTILRIGGVIAATTIAALCFTNIERNLVAAPLDMKSEAEHAAESASYVASSEKANKLPQRESSAFAGEEVNADAPETQHANSRDVAQPWPPVRPSGGVARGIAGIGKTNSRPFLSQRAAFADWNISEGDCDSVAS